MDEPALNIICLGRLSDARWAVYKASSTDSGDRVDSAGPDKWDDRLFAARDALLALGRLACTYVDPASGQQHLFCVQFSSSTDGPVGPPSEHASNIALVQDNASGGLSAEIVKRLIYQAVLSILEWQLAEQKYFRYRNMFFRPLDTSHTAHCVVMESISTDYLVVVPCKMSIPFRLWDPSDRQGPVALLPCGMIADAPFVSSTSVCPETMLSRWKRLMPCLRLYERLETSQVRIGNATLTYPTCLIATRVHIADDGLSDAYLRVSKLASMAFDSNIVFSTKPGTRDGTTKPDVRGTSLSTGQHVSGQTAPPGDHQRTGASTSATPSRQGGTRPSSASTQEQPAKRAKLDESPASPSKLKHHAHDAQLASVTAFTPPSEDNDAPEIDAQFGNVWKMCIDRLNAPIDELSEKSASMQVDEADLVPAQTPESPSFVLGSDDDGVAEAMPDAYTPLGWCSSLTATCHYVDDRRQAAHRRTVTSADYVLGRGQNGYLAVLHQRHQKPSTPYALSLAAEPGKPLAGLEQAPGSASSLPSPRFVSTQQILSFIEHFQESVFSDAELEAVNNRRDQPRLTLERDDTLRLILRDLAVISNMTIDPATFHQACADTILTPGVVSKPTRGNFGELSDLATFDAAFQDHTQLHRIVTPASPSFMSSASKILLPAAPSACTRSTPALLRKHIGFQDHSWEEKPPKIAAGKDDALLAMASKGLPYWQLLDLKPYSGSANVMLVPLHFGAKMSGQTSAYVRTFCRHVANEFFCMRLGTAAVAPHAPSFDGSDREMLRTVLEKHGVVFGKPGTESWKHLAVVVFYTQEQDVTTVAAKMWNAVSALTSEQAATASGPEPSGRREAFRLSDLRDGSISTHFVPIQTLYAMPSNSQLSSLCFDIYQRTGHPCPFTTKSTQGQLLAIETVPKTPLILPTQAVKPEQYIAQGFQLVTTPRHHILFCVYMQAPSGTVAVWVDDQGDFFHSALVSALPNDSGGEGVSHRHTAQSLWERTTQILSLNRSLWHLVVINMGKQRGGQDVSIDTTESQKTDQEHEHTFVSAAGVFKEQGSGLSEDTSGLNGVKGVSAIPAETVWEFSMQLEPFLRCSRGNVFLHDDVQGQPSLLSVPSGERDVGFRLTLLARWPPVPQAPEETRDHPLATGTSVQGLEHVAKSLVNLEWTDPSKTLVRKGSRMLRVVLGALTALTWRKEPRRGLGKHSQGQAPVSIATSTS